MPLNNLDYLGLGFYVFLMLIVAIATRKTSTFKEFSLAGKRLPYFLIFASLASTYVGPGFSIGAADKARETGMLWYLLLLPFAAQTLLVGCFLAPRLAKVQDCNSIGDFIGRKYNNLGHVLAGISSVGICMLFAAYLAKVAGYMLSEITGLPFLIGVVLVTALSASYTFFGGLRASVLTDSVQFAVFTIIIPLVILLAAFHKGITASSIAETAAGLTRNAQMHMSSLAMFGVGLSFLLGETLIPPYANRALASASPGASKKAFVLGAFFCALWLLVVTAIGLISVVIIPSTDSNDGALLGVACQLLPHGLWGILLVAIIGILMSSQDSVLNAGSVSFTRDILNPVIELSRREPLTDRQQVIAGRCGTITVGALAILVAAFLPGIMKTLDIIYSLWAPTVLPPLVIALLVKKHLGKHAAWLSITAGASTSLIWRFVLHEPWGVPTILPGLVANLIAFLFGHWMSARPTKHQQRKGIQ